MSAAISVLPIELLHRRQDARLLNTGVIAALAESIEQIGLINPLRVRRRNSDAGYEVVAGSHRFAACDLAGLREVPCIIVADDDLVAELAMIDENLMRAELSASERAQQTARRKAIYEQLHPETRNGATGNGREKLRQVGEATSDNEINPVDRFTANTAKATGQSERAVQRDAERGAKVIDEAVHLIRGTALDTGAYLDKLKRLPPNEQVFAARRDLGEHNRRQADATERKGGLASRYAPAQAPQELTPTETYERFLKIADAMDRLDIQKLVEGAGKHRSVLGQRASGLADQMGEIMERLSH